MDKRLGILTFHRSINNGAFLQCYSLSNNFEKATGYRVEVIDYNTRKSNNKYIKEIVKSRPVNMKSVYQRFVMFNSFRSVLPYLPLSPRTIIDNDFHSLFEYINDRYAAIVVGSDAVWNWNSRGFPNAYWLNAEFDFPIYSYAASIHGMDYTKADEEQLSYCREALQRYSFIGVRDNATADFVKKIDSDLLPIHTCDPTVILDMNNIPVDMDKLKQKLQKKHGISFNKPLIGIMTSSKRIGQMVRERYCKQYDIVALFKYNCYADYFLYDLNPFEWARVFSFFKLTFSQYFHGTLLSLKNTIPTISIDVWDFSSKFKGKLEDLWERLNFSECYFHADRLNDSDAVNSVYRLADSMLSNPPTERIINAIAQEGKTFMPFLEKLIKERKADA